MRDRADALGGEIRPRGERLCLPSVLPWPPHPGSLRAVFSPTAWVCCRGEQGLNWGGGIYGARGGLCALLEAAASKECLFQLSISLYQAAGICMGLKS